jgi:hypothetical protein
MIQIRNVPEDMHKELKARAAREGMSLSDFLKRELSHLIRRKSLADVFDDMEPYRVDVDHDALLDAIAASKRDRR